MGVAQGAEFPTAILAIHLPKNHGAASSIRRVCTQRISRNLLTLGVNCANVGALNLAEMLLFLLALVNANEKQNLLITIVQRSELHNNLLIVLSSIPSNTIISTVINVSRRMLEAVEKHYIASNKSCVPRVVT